MTSPNTQSGEDELLKQVDNLLEEVVIPVIRAASMGVDGTALAVAGTEKVTAFIRQRESSLLDEVEKRAPKNRTSSAPDYDWDRGAKVGFNAANREWRKALKSLRKELLGE